MAREQVIHKAGEPVPEKLAQALRSIRREAPEFWAKLEKLGFQFYQQPSGFDDGIICAWKVEHQARKAPCSIRLVDSFGGGLSQEVRETAALYNQIISEIEAKMTAALQVTDTDEAFRLKSIQRQGEKKLRKELMRLAEHEDTRAVFKCGVYEVLKLLSTSIETLFTKFEEEDTLKKAMVRNLWTVLRPNVTEGKLEKITEQSWAEGLEHGTHRLKRSWCEKRYDNLNEQGFPNPLPEDEDKLPESQIDASYNVEEGNLMELATWKLMAETGEMTEDAMKFASQMQFIEYEVQGMPTFEGLEEAKKLLASPKQRRIDAGIDPHLTRQGLSNEQRRQRNKRRWERIEERKKGVKGAVEKMRQMSAEGYEPRQIAMSMIKPQMGKKVTTKRKKLSAAEKAKQKLQQSLVRRKNARAKAEAKAKAKAKEAEGVEVTELDGAAEPEERWEDC